MAFIQLIEFSTHRIDEVEAAVEDWRRQSKGRRRATRTVGTQDRDRPQVYVQLVEFPSYEEAMENSRLPETAELADRLAKLCDAAPTFRNLEVTAVEDL